MSKRNRARAAQVTAIICLLAAGALLYHLLTRIVEDIGTGGISGQATRLEFHVDNPEGTGFHRDLTVYTENGITSVSFTGKLTVDGTAEIIVTANEDGGTVYQETYSDLTAEPVQFKVDGLTPDAFYTLSFSSQDASKGHLLLGTNESLVERPEPPARPEHSAPIRGLPRETAA